MPLASWALGFLFGIVVGGSALLAGVFALLLLVPALVWAWRERMRPFGLAGLLFGIGSGGDGLILLSQGSCLRFTNDSGGTSIRACAGGTDLTWYLVLGLVFLAAGLLTTWLGRRRVRAT